MLDPLFLGFDYVKKPSHAIVPLMGQLIFGDFSAVLRIRDPVGFYDRRDPDPESGKEKVRNPG
jgi:hypothetical protein